MDLNNTMQPFSLVQWNARSLKHKSFNLANVSDNFNIATISETWLRPNEEFYLRGFDIVRKDRNDGRGDVAILVKNTIKYKKLSNLFDCNSKIEICGIEILLNKKLFKIISCYRSPTNVNIFYEEWSRFFNSV